ncbi:hypothetical protein M885DRAFT_625747, partial [Pelagophyceae sp. CCMP2097]
RQSAPHFPRLASAPRHGVDADDADGDVQHEGFEGVERDRRGHEEQVGGHLRLRRRGRLARAHPKPGPPRDCVESAGRGHRRRQPRQVPQGLFHRAAKVPRRPRRTLRRRRHRALRHPSIDRRSHAAATRRRGARERPARAPTGPSPGAPHGTGGHVACFHANTRKGPDALALLSHSRPKVDFVIDIVAR